MFLKLPKLVDFDPSIKSHRQSVFDFRKRRAWADAKIRFTYDPEFGSVVTQVESKLLQFYIDRELKGKSIDDSEDKE